VCLGIPGRVVAAVEGYGDQLMLVDVAGRQDKVNIGMLDGPQPAPGDWVLIHLGFAVERIDEARASLAMEGLELMGRGRDVDT
jgi:hydrogenase expression/formation protein HypC